MPAKHARSRWILAVLIVLIVVGVFLFVDFRSYPQGEWSADMKDKFYFADQGSKLLPADWFMSLPAVGTGDARLTDNLDRFGFILTKRPNKYNLPIGFAVHQETDGQEWIGLTCAACHTGRVVLEDGRDILVEGGQSLLDFDSFFADVMTSLSSVVAGHERFSDFATRVNESAVKHGRSALSEQDLKAAVDARIKVYQARLKYNTPTLKAGFGRVDAFGQIFNQVGAALHNPLEKLPPPDAPASYPFIWDTPKHKAVQWNGSAPNLGVQRTGSMLRNIGEVIGVFGEIEIVPNAGAFTPSYKNSANYRNLEEIEAWVTSLASPKWPGKIDSALAATGKGLYDVACAKCHAVVDPSNTPVPTPVTMTAVADVGTDPAHSDSFLKRMMLANDLNGHLSAADPRHPFARFGPEPPARDLTVNGAVGARGFFKPPFINSTVDAIKAFVEGTPTDEELNRYKARPLNGIWATAPYLHNGSVLTLWELMLPVDARMKTFCVGTAQFDSKNVGYRNDCTGRHSEFDTSKPGNHNTGHMYGAGLKEPEKWALLEYMKTL